MTSECHSGPEDLILDAARACVLAVGLRRTTLTDVARRAGVSRMTVYRRWPDMASLIGDLMTREWGALFTFPAAGTARQRLVEGIVDGVGALRSHPVFRRIVELDPEIMLPYLVDRRGTSQDRILDRLTAAIAEGRPDGSLRAGDPALIARTLLLTAHGFVFSAHTMADDVTVTDLDAELRVLLDRYLSP